MLCIMFQPFIECSSTAWTTRRCRPRLSTPGHPACRATLVPERADFVESDAPAADKIHAFLARAVEATGSDAPAAAGALVPWICNALLPNHFVKAYGRDFMDFVRHKQAQGVTPLEIAADLQAAMERFGAIANDDDEGMTPSRP
jgi:hypothetical protein